MSRRVTHLKPVPTPNLPDGAKTPDNARLLTIKELSDRLQLSRSKIERDVDTGLPAIDVGRHYEGRRMKRSLRFSWPEVLDWYRKGR